MSHIPPEHLDFAGRDVNNNQVEMFEGKTMVNSRAESPSLDEMAKDLDTSLTISEVRTSEATSSEDDDVDGGAPLDGGKAVEAADADAADAVKKKAAMNKRKKQNNKRNKAAAKAKEAEEIPQPKTPEVIDTAQGTNPRVMAKRSRANGKSSIEQQLLDFIMKNIEHVIKTMRSMSAEEIRASRVSSCSKEEVSSWERLGADAWKGFEDDDVENDPSTPGVPAFEIKASQLHGLGLFATRNIKKDTEIFREAALIESVGKAQTPLHLEAFFQVLPDEKKAQVLALTGFCACKKVPCVDTPLTKVWRTNRFKSLLGEMPAEYLYNISSRINHDCRPSSYHMYSKEGHIGFFAARGIRKGEEITQDYIGGAGPAKMRRSALKDKYSFTCECSACVGDVVLPPSHAIDVYNDHNTREIEDEGADIIGMRSVAEAERMNESVQWTNSIQGYLKKAEVMVSSRLFDQAAEEAKAPRADSEVVKSIADKLKEGLKGVNSLGVVDEILDGLADAIMTRTLGAVEDSYKDLETT